MTTPNPESTDIAPSSTDGNAGTAAGAEAGQTPDVAEVGDQPDVVEHQDDVTTKAGRDAAKYRAQLRETETQLGATQAALAAQQRAIVDRHAGAPGPERERFRGERAAVAPELLDANGFELADVLDENGLVDLEAVEAFAAATANKFGIVHRGGFKPNRGQNQIMSFPPGFRGGQAGGIADAFRK